ncbi:hypothetical protein [Streptomyces griseorubiginosus]|uniref:hypothetical protein n=1 Tax=Streptomyces griseorubiginosus TaxID=67304 RepID=UPI0036E59F8E
MTTVTRWFDNADAIAAPDDCAWAPWVRHTRVPPPDRWQDTDSVAAYTEDEQALNTGVHEAAHAVVYMAAGYQVEHIVLFAPDDLTRLGRAAVRYAPASGPWLDWAVTCAAGERAELRWMRETGRWSPERAWVAERLAWRDRSQVGAAYLDCHGRELTFHGDHDDWGDYAWVMDRTDEALDRVWDQVLALGCHLARHRRVTGGEAARIAGLAHGAPR